MKPTRICLVGATGLVGSRLIAAAVSRPDLRIVGIARRETLPVDQCAGWAEGGALIKGFSELGTPIQIGPRCPALADNRDPLGWHAFAQLASHGTRRARRLPWEPPA